MSQNVLMTSTMLNTNAKVLDIFKKQECDGNVKLPTLEILWRYFK